MNKLNAAHLLVELAVSSGTGAIVANAVRHTTPDTVTKLQKGLIFVGGVAISSLVGDAAASHANQYVDKFVKDFSAMAEKAKEQKD